jgi:hypothetical protein
MVEAPFPDGTVREVPSVTREIQSKEIGPYAQSSFVEEPGFDPDWRFPPAHGGKSFAKPRP